MLELGPITATDVFTQAVDVVFRVPEDDRQHEFPLRVVFETERGKAQILQTLRIEEIDDSTAVDGVSRETVRMPGNDALGVPCFDSLEHGVKNRSSRRLRAERFFIRLDDLDIAPSRTQTFHFLALGFDGEDLTIFVFAGFAAIQEIFHVRCCTAEFLATAESVGRGSTSTE